MITVDREFEKEKDELLVEGMDALQLKLDRYDITTDNLGLYLYTKDVDLIDRDSVVPRNELVDEFDENVNEARKYRNAKTLMWLGRGGFKIINKELPNISCLHHLCKWQDFWCEVFASYDSPKEREYYTPSLLHWALYLTVRGPVPKDFPLDGAYTYAIKRWTDLYDLALQEKELYGKGEAELIMKRLKSRCTDAETYVARVDGNYDQLQRDRVLKGAIDLDKVKL